MSKQELQSRFTDFLRDLAWESFESKFASPAAIPGTYGIFLEAVHTSRDRARRKLLAWTGRQYRVDELQPLSVCPWISEARLFDLIHDPLNWSRRSIDWSLNDGRIPSPFRVWFVHH